MKKVIQKVLTFAESKTIKTWTALYIVSIASAVLGGLVQWAWTR